MQLANAPATHLTYCSNVHLAANLDALLANTERYGVALRERLGAGKPFGLGLHIPAAAARELVLGNRIAELQELLARHQLYVFTLNGFPYDTFHGGRIKSAVFAPDWRDLRRLDYTLLLLQILERLAPPGLEGGISTLPISMKEWVEHPSGIVAAEKNLLAWVEAAMELHANTGKIVHLDIEPEPAGWLETSVEVVSWFESVFLLHGARYLAARRGLGRHAAEAAIRTHVRVCYDTCHLAVRYEEPHTVFERFAQHGIQIGKLQISSALRAILPPHRELREEIARQLQGFAEPTYLHQVVALGADGSVAYLGDLEKVLPTLATSLAREWRIHFHVPLFASEYGLVRSTQRDTATALFEALRYEIAHWEIETYTWGVLPAGKPANLIEQLIEEYRWVLGRVEQFAGSPQRRAA